MKVDEGECSTGRERRNSSERLGTSPARTFDGDRHDCSGEAPRTAGRTATA